MNLGFYLNGFFGQEMSVQVWNNNPDWVEIVWIHLIWPVVPNGSLVKIKLEGNLLWNGIDSDGDAWVYAPFDEGPAIIPDFQDRELRFFFENDAAMSTGYWLEIGFSNGCVKADGG
jgi:hypothetical protein